MNNEVQERIEMLRNNQLPSGYCYIKNIGITPEDWKIGRLSDIIENIQRPVFKPNKPYWRLGIKSWAKGTFHAYVDNPETVNMDELYEVRENDLIVNITFAWEHAIAIAKKEDSGLLVSHRFPTYVFKEGQNPKYYEKVITQHYFKDMLEHISPGGAGRNRVLNRKDFLNLPCCIPSRREQEKIVEILSACDQVIEGYERKKENLIKLKKSYLDRMFPRKGSGVPEIRFQRFNTTWEQRKLGKMGSLKNGMNFSKDAMDKGYPFVNLQNIFGNNVIDVNNLGKAEASTQQLKEYSLEKGDVLFVRSSVKLEGVGEAALVPKTLENTTYSGFVIRFRDEVGLNDNFKRFVFSIKPVRNQIMAQATNSANKNVSQDVLANLDIPIPDFEEQEKIGSYFSALDHLITLHQRMIDTQRRYKDAIRKLLLTGIVRV